MLMSIGVMSRHGLWRPGDGLALGRDPFGGDGTDTMCRPARCPSWPGCIGPRSWAEVAGCSYSVGHLRRCVVPVAAGRPAPVWHLVGSRSSLVVPDESGSP